MPKSRTATIIRIARISIFLMKLLAMKEPEKAAAAALIRRGRLL